MGGSCRGAAFRVEARRADATRAYLQEREQVTSVYVETMKAIELVDSRERVEALCFVVDRKHAQYAGSLDFDRQVALIAAGEGQSGKNPEYLESTVRHLEDAGIADAALNRLWCAVEERLRQPAPSR